MSARRASLALLLLAVAGCGKETGRVSLQADWFVGDHMVLQRDKIVVITGAAQCGETVTVSLGEDSRSVVADDEDRFAVHFPSQSATRVGQRLEIRTDEAELSFKDVVVGEVWILAGRQGVDPNEPSPVRVCRRTGDWSTERRPLTPVESASVAAGELRGGAWQLPSPATTAFSNKWATFGGTRGADLDVPIGLIDVSCAGATLESWIPLERLASDSRLNSLAFDFPESPLTSIAVRGLVRSQLRDWILSGRNSTRPPHHLEPGYLNSRVIEQLSRFSVYGVALQMNAEVTRAPWVAERLTRMLISSWREQFRDSRLNFLLEELPGSTDAQAPLYRERQRALTEMGHVLIGTAYDLAAENTSTIGVRLARPEASSWNVSVEPKGDSLWLKGPTVSELRWASGFEGLGFELADESLCYYPAVATLADEGLQLRAAEVAIPIAARYAWSPSPSATLLNKANRPLAPFRTQSIRPIKVACIGDSLTVGFGLQNPEFDAYPAQLARQLGDRFLVGNFSRSATTASGTRFPGAWNPVFCETREYGQALAFEPQIVVCNLGTNDLTHWWSSGAQRADQFEAEYEDLIAAFKLADQAPAVFLWSPIAPLYPGQANYGDAREAELNESLSRLAKRIGAEEINLHASCGGRSEWFPDKLHPDSSGSRAIAAAVQAALGEHLTEAAVPPLKPLQLVCVQAHPSRSHGLPTQKNHAADKRRLVFRPRPQLPNRLILGQLGGSPRLKGLGRALWDKGLREFALVPFEGDGLASQLDAVRRELPRNQTTRVLTVIAPTAKFQSIPECRDAILLAPRQFDSDQDLVTRLLELRR